MGILSKLEQRPGAGPTRAQGYAAAQFSRLTASLQNETQFINTTLRFQLRVLRARARQLAKNNPYAKRFVQVVVDNVCGPQPFRLQGKIKNRMGDLNDQANDAIETTWDQWGRAGSCEITGKWSWNAVQRLLVRNLAVDGEILIRKLKGPEYGPHGFKLQVIDVDRLWEYKNEALANGGAIHASVEVDANARPVAYHLLKRKPSQWQYSGYSLETDRVPADEIIHVFIPEDSEQVRGVPWMYAALLNLVHLGSYEEAAVIAARVGAANMAFLESPDGGKTLADMAGAAPRSDGTDELGGDGAQPGDASFSAEPAEMHFLPPGYKFSGGWNPKYPDAAFEPFIRACLRGISAGFNVSYHVLSNDLANVNYSTGKIGQANDRDTWMGLQTFVCEHLHCRLYDDWMPQQILMGKLPFNPASDMDKYREVRWRGRRWMSIEPLKEIGAAIEAVNEKLKSRTEVIADMGGDIEETWEELQSEQQMAADMDIELDPVKPKVSGTVNEPGVPAGDAGNVPEGEPADSGNKKRILRAVPRYRDAAYTGE